MSTTRVRIDPDDPASLPEGRIDAAVADATTEAEIALQQEEDDAEDAMAAKRATFLAVSARLRWKTAGRKQTPAEVLIRENRTLGHRAV